MKFPYKLIDLTHTLDENCPTWDNSCGFEKENIIDYKDCKTEVKFRVQHFKMHAGIGTHIDAPNHCIKDGVSVDQLKLDDLVSPCVVIDVFNLSHERFSLSTEDIEKFEKLYGLIPENALVMIRTGWDRFWDNPEKYRNNHIFPSISKEAAIMLLKRGVAGVGIDTLSPDRPDDGFEVHQAFLSAGKYIVENATNLNALPPIGSFIMVIPIKVRNATEAPLRLIGMINN